eukprot:CCRYP_007280-RA/>CCRYP_007280-RA protein AED:0.35 eAED:0.51 QI:0/0/0/1/0/0/2/0/115
MASVIPQTRHLSSMGSATLDTLKAKISNKFAMTVFAVESLVLVMVDCITSPHQYARTDGRPNLVQQLAKRHSNHLQQTIDPMNIVAVIVDSSQGLYLSLQTLVKPGDKVIPFAVF